jgi:hypothetical protein
MEDRVGRAAGRIETGKRQVPLRDVVSANGTPWQLSMAPNRLPPSASLCEPDGPLVCL